MFQLQMMARRTFFAVGPLPSISQHFAGGQLYRGSPLPCTAHSQLLQQDRSSPAHLHGTSTSSALITAGAARLKQHEMATDRCMHREEGRWPNPTWVCSGTSVLSSGLKVVRSSAGALKETFLYVTATTASTALSGILQICSHLMALLHSKRMKLKGCRFRLPLA